MPWGAVAGAVVGAVANKALAPKSSSGGGGGSGSDGPPAYVPKDQAGADANFLGNKGAYEQTLQGQQNLLDPYNHSLLTSAFTNNPYTNINQKNANDASAAFSNAGQYATNQGNVAWDNATNQMVNGQISNDRFNQNFGNVQNSANAMYGMADQSNTNYQNLMDYQKGQLGNIQQSQGNLYNSGNQVLNTAFDPQQALYNRTQQQLTDQSRASEYARGIQTTPYGAALENSANQNFNIDWQNQQLTRQAQGMQAAQGAYGSAQGMGNSYTGAQAGLNAGKNEQYAGLTNAAQSQYANYLGAMNQNSMLNAQNLAGQQQNAMSLQNQGAQAAIAAGQAPLNAFQQNYNMQNQALQGYAANNQPYMQGLNQLQSNDLGYMNYGQGAQNQSFNQNAYNTTQRQNAISSISGPIGSAVSKNWGNISDTVGGWFGGGTDSSSGNDAALMNWANSSGY